MSLSEWLDAVLHESTEDRTRAARRRDDRLRRRDDPLPDRSRSRDGIDARTSRRDTEDSSERNTPRGPQSGRGPKALHGIAERLDRLGARVPEAGAPGDDRRRGTRDTIRELEGRLKDIARRVESHQRADTSAHHAPDAGPDGSPDGSYDSDSYDTPRASARPPLTTVSRKAPDRAETSPAPMDGLKEAIAGIASRQKTLEVEFDRAVSGYADRIDHRIDLVSERLERTIDESLPTGELREIRMELRGLSERQAPGARDSSDFEELRLTVEAMLDRIEAMPGQLATDLAERLEDTARRLDTATRSELDAIRAELREIARDIDRTTRNEFESLRGEIGLLAARIESMPAPDSDAIEQKLEDIAARLGAAAREEFGAIRSEIREIADVVDRNTGREDMESLRQELRAFAAREAGVDRDDFETLREDLRALGEQLQAERSSLVARGVDEAGIAELDAIRSDIRAVAEQIDSVRRDDYPALKRDLKAVGEQVSRASAPDLAALEKQIGLLGSKLAGAASDGDPEALAQIEQQISRLAEAVDSSTRAPAAALDLDKSFDDLFDRFARNSTDTVSAAAREAANAAVEQALSKLNAGAGTAEIVSALREEIATLRGDTVGGHKTEDAFQAVHTTLLKIVDRLEHLEDEVDGVARKPARAEPAGRRDSTVRPDSTVRAEPKNDLVATPEAAALTASADDDEDDDTGAAIEDDTPLAPGTGRPAAALARSADDAADAGGDDAGSSPSSDFVAAARRAAQAATAEQAGGAKPQKVKGSAVAGLRSGLKKYRRPLAIAAIMLIVIYGAVKAGSLLRSMQQATSSLDQPTVAQTLETPAAKTKSAAKTGQASKAADPASAPATDSADDRATETLPIVSQPRNVLSQTADSPAKAAKKAARAANQARSAGTQVASVAPLMTDAVSTGSIPDTAATGPLGGSDDAVLDELPASMVPERLRRAAAAADPAAEFEIAVRYMDGRGLPQDSAKAAEWYRKAAAQGLAPAQYRLGSLYEKGDGVARDLSMARMWYQRAAEQGNRKAMHNLAVLYADGVDGKPDYEKAATWFHQAAEYGLADSQFNLAVLYARGLGVQTDFAESFRWFSIAADQGDGEALNKRDEIARQMDKETLEKARAALDAWTAREPLMSANVVAEPQGGWGEANPPRLAATDRDMIMSVQSMLSKLGYTPGPADGEIGPRTRDAVRAFQRAIGLPATGDITPDLVRALDKSAG